MTPDAWCGIHGYRARPECPGCPTPGETRRQELAREYEGVPSAQAFIAVCDRLIAAERIAQPAREYVEATKNQSHELTEVWNRRDALIAAVEAEEV